LESLNNNWITNSEYVIISVRDPVRRIDLSLEEAIDCGLFDSNCGMYIMPHSNQHLSIVEAIDQRLLTIADKTFKSSHMLTLYNNTTLNNNSDIARKINRIFIRFIVDTFNGQILPFNVAYRKGFVNIENETIKTNTFDGGDDKKMKFREAYYKYLALTDTDVDTNTFNDYNLENNRRIVQFNVELVRKTTTGKSMSASSAAAKGWINMKRRTFIDKATTTELTWSQAIDMNLLVLTLSSQMSEPIYATTSKSNNNLTAKHQRTINNSTKKMSSSEGNFSARIHNQKFNYN
jgi:hypothetical protein